MTIDNAPFAGELAGRRKRRNSQTANSWILGLLGVALALVLTGALVWLSTGLGLLHLIGVLRGQSIVNVNQPTIVRQIQQLQRLETVSYTADKIISGGHANAYLPNFLAGDRLLLVVHGEVIAGINLAGLQPEDVEIQGQKVSIHLPPGEVLSTRIDSAKTRVYSRETGLFSSPDPNLESEVRAEAERELQHDAVEDGILKTAADNAGGTIRAMLRGFGFRDVQIR